MNQEERFSGKSASSVLQPKAAGNQPQRAPAMAKMSAQRTAVNQNSRAPIATAAHRVPVVPQVLQARLRHGPATQSRTIAGPASGVLQANVIGGHYALQARLNQWNARLTHGANLTVGQQKNANHGPASGAPNGSRAIQRKTGPGVEAFQVPLRQKSGGLPIPDQVRAKMESALGADFSDVRVHVGQEASSLGAIAYTWGTNIHFAPGQYNPNTIQGQKLLGHELWHVVQQRAGRVSNPFGGGVAVVQDHALEAEADRMGIKAAMTALVQRPGADR
jgi:hypothetical protein